MGSRVEEQAQDRAGASAKAICHRSAPRDGRRPLELSGAEVRKWPCFNSPSRWPPPKARTHPAPLPPGPGPLPGRCRVPGGGRGLPASLASLALYVIHWPRAFGWDRPTPPGPDALGNEALGTLPKKRSEARLEGRQAPWRSPRWLLLILKRRVARACAWALQFSNPRSLINRGRLAVSLTDTHANERVQ